MSVTTSNGLIVANVLKEHSGLDQLFEHGADLSVFTVICIEFWES
jgi:hypothetical protein